MIDWKIWYSDYSTFDSSQGVPADAPGMGVICIVTPDSDCGCYAHAMSDYYIYTGTEHPWLGIDKWLGVDWIGFIDYMQHPGHKVVKFGRNVASEIFHDILRQSHNDPDFPDKSAYRRGEVKPR